MKTVLLKVSGELFADDERMHSKKTVVDFVDQVQQLRETHFFGIVIGGGNFFRGKNDGPKLDLRRVTADSVGMLATVMSGLILHDSFSRGGIDSVLLSSCYMPQFAQQISQAAIDDAFKQRKVIIFVGGTGSPFFSTDTNAVVRALQVGAKEIWKATKVDYLYDGDPKIKTTSKPILQASYEEVVDRGLKVMDLTAITLAQEHQLPIRIFNIFKTNALLEVANNQSFGSTVC